MNASTELIRKLCNDYNGIFEKDEIELIVEGGGSLKEDITLLSGAHLEVCRLRLLGNKSKNTEGEFKYEREFYPGINTLVSDNLKGKSSILKCIKFALSGKNSLKKDVSNWIDQIFLEFKIGQVTYTSYIDNSSVRTRAKLFRADIAQHDAGNVREIDYIFNVSSKEELVHSCEMFFYKQLGVTSLKWTQKDSRKHVNELHEAGTSWHTFFKAIYLESKDSGTLIYGSQGELLFQILLGLGFTSSMNRLKVLKEKLQFESSKNGSVDERANADAEKLMLRLEENIDLAKKEINAIKNTSTETNVKEMMKEKSSLIQKMQSLEDRHLKDITQNSETEREILKLTARKSKIDEDKCKLKKQNDEINKNILRIEEHVEIGSFFSNLEISSCPSCNSNLKPSNLKLKNSNSCGLCRHDIKDTDRQEDVSRLEARKESLEQEYLKIDEQLRILDSVEININSELENAKTSVKSIDQSSIDEEAISLMSLVNILDEKIEMERDAIDGSITSLREVEDNLAVLNYRLSEAKNSTLAPDENQNPSKVMDKISLLDSAIKYLEHYRVTANTSILKEFKGIILNVLHSLGLESFTDIEIDAKLRIKYIQGGERLSYSDISEGEQLRVKIALYLSLVKLNSEHGVGNHPRFLIIDSPGKEEADDKYFDGLIETLNTVEEQFSNKIQILIGTADRRLSNIVPSEKQEIKDKEEVFF